MAAFARDEMRQRTQAFRKRLTDASGGMCSAAEAAKLLDVDPIDLDGMRARREVLGIPVDDEIRYPRIQFLADEPVPGLPLILRAFDDMQPWVQLQMLLSPLTGFADEPTSMIALLRAGVSDGKLEQLRRLARSWAS